MSKAQQPISSKSYEAYNYYEVNKGVSLSANILEKWKKVLLSTKSKGKRALLSLPGNCKIDPKKQASFLRFMQQQMQESYMFVPQDALQWGSVWRSIVKHNLNFAEKAKAFDWAEGKLEQTPARVTSLELGDTFYIKCAGDFAEGGGTQLDKKIQEALNVRKVRGEHLPKQRVVEGKNSLSWITLASALIIDVTDVTILSPPLIKAISKALEKHELTAESPGVYFVTSGLFQTWTLRQSLGEIAEMGNIVRVLPENVEASHNVQEEAKQLFAHIQEYKPQPILFYHQVNGLESAKEVISLFSPEIVVSNEIKTADRLRELFPRHKTEKTYHITPATRAGLMLLGPQMITEGYDLDLFAQYLLSRYQNNHGKPNDTFIYYFQSHPQRLQQVANFILAEFSYIFSESHSKVLEKVSEYETDAKEQGHFLISSLEEQVLQIHIDLYLTVKGYGSFLSSYSEIFPSHQLELCSPLKFFVRADSNARKIQAKMHVIEDYNEITVQEEHLQIDTRISPNQSILTVKAEPHEKLEMRCKTLFTLLNGSEVFNQLPDKEILIELISLLWGNFQASLQKSQGFLISLLCDAQNTKMEVFQSKSNKAVLTEGVENEKQKIRFSGDTLFHPASQRCLLKIVSLFFQRPDKQDPTDNSWRFACFEALNQVAAGAGIDQLVSFDLQLFGDRWSAVFISENQTPNIIPERSQQTFHAGADKVELSEDGRQITLIKNPFPGEEEQKYRTQMLEMQDAMDNLKESDILQEVADVKAREEAQTNAKLQASYESALKRYNEKFGGAEEEQDYSKDLQKRGKSLEDALRTRTMKTSELEKRQQKIAVYSLTTLVCLSLFGLAIVVYLFSAEGTRRQGRVVRDIGNVEGAIPPPAPAQAATSSTTAQTAQTQENSAQLEPDPAASIVQEITRLLYRHSAPSQEDLNTYLKKLYQKRNEYSQSGDYHNIVARLYWYKIYLDRESKIFKPEWVDRWKKLVQSHWQRAESLYRQKEYRTNFSLAIQPWMPERDFYFYQKRRTDIERIEYASPEEAAENMKELLQGVSF